MDVRLESLVQRAQGSVHEAFRAAAVESDASSCLAVGHRRPVGEEAVAGRSGVREEAARIRAVGTADGRSGGTSSEHRVEVACWELAEKRSDKE